MNNKHLLPYWAVIPAAGVGRRMQSNIPKQYLPLADKTVLEHTLTVFTQHPLIEGIVISISDGDEYWPEVLKAIRTYSNKTILIAKGGKERKDSVLSALNELQKKINKNAWVLVHDAARPCLLAADIDKLINRLNNKSMGGLLALPVSDTLKRAVKTNKTTAADSVVDNIVDSVVDNTVNRENIWRALTPQMFHLDDLLKALELFQDQNITDESSAIELLGIKPLLIEGHATNIKITHPNDLILAEHYFQLDKVSDR